jgi:hypothetical protein
MSKIYGRTITAIVAVVLSLSLMSAADAGPCSKAGTITQKPNYPTCSLVRPKGASMPQIFPALRDESRDYYGFPWPGFGLPQQDPRDAWDGYFANPLDNPNYHGSNGG